MNGDSQENEEGRLSEMISTADIYAPQPDREFLAGLKMRSTLRFVESASSAGKSRRSLIMARVKRFAPGAVAAGLLVAIGVAVVLLPGSGESGVAWADVRKRIEQAKCMKMKMVLAMPDGTKIRARYMMAEGGLMRQEVSVDGEEMVLIANMKKGVILRLMKNLKLARKMHIKDMPKVMRDQMVKQKNYLAELKKMIGKAEKELGEKTIDGVKVKGFRVSNTGMVMDIWVDPKTSMPIRIEGKMTDGGKMVMSDIELIEKIDPGLFSLEAPKGYKIQQELDISMKIGGVKELTDVLKAWTQFRDGAFPDAINSALFMKDAQKHIGKLTDADVPLTFKEIQALIDRVVKTPLMRLGNVTKLMQSNETFHYQGKGVKLGEKDTAVLWYKPEGKDKYVVMFGDLHVKRMLKKDLPPKRKNVPAKPAPGKAGRSLRR